MNPIPKKSENHIAKKSREKKRYKKEEYDGSEQERHGSD